MPKWYIGSSYEEKILKGYNGSVHSKKWKSIYKSEQKENKYLFKTRILSFHKSRTDAHFEELRLQKMHQVVKNVNYFNEAYAQPNGFFGRDVSGVSNPMFGKIMSQDTKDKIRIGNLGTKWTDEQKHNHSIRLSGVPKPKKSESMKGSGNSFYGKTHTLKNKSLLRNKATNGKRYNVYDINDEIILEDVMQIDVIGLSQTLINRTKENRLGKTSQAKEIMIKQNKEHLIGCYCVEVK